MNSSLLGEKTTRTKNSNVNHTTQTPSTYVRAGSVSISYCNTASVPLTTCSVLFIIVLKASCVSRQKVVIETRMKNKEAKAMNWNKKREKRHQNHTALHINTNNVTDHYKSFTESSPNDSQICMHKPLHLGQRRGADSSQAQARSLGWGKVSVMDTMAGCNSFRKWQQIL